MLMKAANRLNPDGQPIKENQFDTEPSPRPSYFEGGRRDSTGTDQSNLIDESKDVLVGTSGIIDESNLEIADVDTSP